LGVTARHAVHVLPLDERAVLAHPRVRDRIAHDDVVAEVLGFLDALDIGQRREAFELVDVEVELVGVQRRRAALAVDDGDAALAVAVLTHELADRVGDRE